MRDQITIARDDYICVLRALEKSVYILDRCQAREDPDNYAYALAIACAKSELLNDMAAARTRMYQTLSTSEFDELDEAGTFDLEIEDIAIPYDDSLKELREQLEPYLPKYKKTGCEK